MKRRFNIRLSTIAFPVLFVGFAVLLFNLTTTPIMFRDCSPDQVETIAENLEWGTANVFMYGTTSEYAAYVDETIMEAYKVIRTAPDRRENYTETTFYAVENINVTDVSIMSCWQNRIIYTARIETANVAYDKPNGEIVVPCYGLAEESAYKIVKREGVWKYSGTGFLSSLLFPHPIDTHTPVEELRSSICDY